MTKNANKTIVDNVTSIVTGLSERKAELQAQALEIGKNAVRLGLSIVSTDISNPLSIASSASEATRISIKNLNDSTELFRIALDKSPAEKLVITEAGKAKLKNRLKKVSDVEQNPPTVSDKNNTINNTNSNIIETNLTVVTVANSNDIEDRIISEISTDTRGDPLNRERSTGIIIKPEKRATLSLFSVSGKPRKESIREFFLTGVREDTSEKFQIVQTFGTDYIFFFNRKPLIYTINGIFYNTEDKQWRNKFKNNYDSLFRGTQLVKGRNKLVFTYDDVVRHGYLLNLSYTTESSNPNAVPFTFSMFVIKESKIGQTPGREGEATAESEEIEVTTT